MLAKYDNVFVVTILGHWLIARKMLAKYLKENLRFDVKIFWA